ncbi:MAG TPA: Wzz/FepE/Etk N-terminal domain-containing protein [Longimicrobium sp.]|nr:Wzz/FepE/Etk N-terminal domain-containing protein [Longimicrobium sp.]
MTPDTAAPRPAPAEATLLDFAAVLLRRWKLILLTTLAVAALTAVYALTRPRVYTAAVTLVPSATGGGDARAQMLAAQLPGFLRLGGGGGNPAQAMVQAILNSGSLRDSVARAVARTPEGRAAPAGELGRVMSRQTQVTSDPADRSITVAVTATDPRLAARLAGAVPDAVNTIASALSLEAADRRRETLQKQLDTARERLAASEERLRDFERRNQASALPEQARQSVEAAAELRRLVNAAELRLATLRRSTTPENPQYRAAEAELAGLRRQLRQITSGSGGEGLIGGGAAPDIKMQALRLTRQYNADEQAYLALSAEIMGQEAGSSDLTVVSVLDAPSVPGVPSGPRVKLLVVLGIMLGGVMALFLAFTVDYVARARGSSEHQDFFRELDRFSLRRRA